MAERDSLQLIDLDLIYRILQLDDKTAWAFVTEHLDRLRSLKQFHSGFLYALPHGDEHFEKCFYRFWADDPDKIRQGLIIDLAYLGDEVPLDYYSRAAYLDHAASTRVQTSREIIPEWDEYSEAHAFASLFDVLDARQVGKIARAMKQYHIEREPGMQLDYLKLELMEKACRDDPSFKVAYMYETRYAMPRDNSYFQTERSGNR